MVEFRDPIGQVLIADAVDHVDMLAGMQVIEAQAVGRRAVIHCAAREYTQERKENKQLSDCGALNCHGVPPLYREGYGSTLTTEIVVRFRTQRAGRRSSLETILNAPSLASF